MCYLTAENRLGIVNHSQPKNGIFVSDVANALGCLTTYILVHRHSQMTSFSAGKCEALAVNTLATWLRKRLKQ
jgi:hypothetical protein